MVIASQHGHWRQMPDVTGCAGYNPIITDTVIFEPGVKEACCVYNKRDLFPTTGSG